jgi:hypothetical protein
LAFSTTSKARWTTSENEKKIRILNQETAVRATFALCFV